MIKSILANATLALVFITLLSNAFITESIRVGDQYEYSFKGEINIHAVLPKQSTGQGDLFECKVKMEMSGIIVYEINNIYTETTSVKITYRDIKFTYSIKCNDTEVENEGRRSFEEVAKNVNEMRGKEFSLNVPIMYEFSKAHEYAFPILQQLGIPTVGPGFDPLNLEYKYSVVRTTYRNKPCLLVESRVETTQTSYGVTLTAYGRMYTDFTGGVTYYSVGEADLAMRYEGSRGFINQKIKLELELRDIQTLYDYETIGLEIRFKDKRGEVFITAHGIKLNNYKIDRNRLILNISGSGVGGVLVNITKDVSLLNIYIDGRRGRLIRDEFSGYTLFKTPVSYSDHILEIEFSEELTEVKQTTLKTPVLETFILVSIILVLIAVPVLILLSIYKRLKKT